MKRILIPLCIVVGSHVAYGQRSYQFDAPNRLFVEGKELFSLKNYAGCIDKLEAYKQHSTDARPDPGGRTTCWSMPLMNRGAPMQTSC